MQKSSCAVTLLALMLAACGGGGGGGSTPTLVRTTINGTVTPPATPTSGALTASTTVIVPPNSTATWQSIVQGSDYTFETAGLNAVPSTFKAISISIKPVNTATGSTSITTGAAYPTDATQGQLLAVTNTLAGISYSLFQPPGVPVTPGTVTANAFGTGLASVSLAGQLSTTTLLSTEYALPFSATLSPAGYSYQTFGYWATTDNTTGIVSEFFFSTGAPTVGGTIPTSGTASYVGHATGSYLDANTREPSTVSATMNATANFASASVAFSTTGTTTLSGNAPAGTVPTANPGLNLSGTLNYAAGSNTFTGTVATVNGMSGNATGRFYGPGIATATATKVAGAPPEIGGTFAVMNTTGGAMQGAFGGK